MYFFCSVYVHLNKIQETLFNVILIFRQGNRETRVGPMVL